MRAKVQRPTSKVKEEQTGRNRSSKFELWMFGVRCSAFDVVAGPLAGKYLPKPRREILQSFWRIAPALLRHDPARVADFIDRFHHRRPIVVAFEQRHLEALPQTFLFASFAAVFLDVKFLNTLTQDAYPLLRPAIGDHIANIK